MTSNIQHLFVHYPFPYPNCAYVSRRGVLFMPHINTPAPRATTPPFLMRRMQALSQSNTHSSNPRPLEFQRHSTASPPLPICITSWLPVLLVRSLVRCGVVFHSLVFISATKCSFSCCQLNFHLCQVNSLR